jgi:hypothetical protein
MLVVGGIDMRAYFCIALLTVAACGPASMSPEDSGTVTPDGETPDAATVPVDSATPASYAAVHALFQERCSGYCHGGGSDVGASVVFASDVGVPASTLVGLASREVPRMQLVVPGNPDESYLIQKLDGTFRQLPECEPVRNNCGVGMPWSAGTPAQLSRDEIDLVRNWILDGAPETP